MYEVRWYVSLKNMNIIEVNLIDEHWIEFSPFLGLYCLNIGIVFGFVHCLAFSTIM